MRIPKGGTSLPHYFRECVSTSGENEGNMILSDKNIIFVSDVVLINNEAYGKIIAVHICFNDFMYSSP